MPVIEQSYVERFLLSNCVQLQHKLQKSSTFSTITFVFLGFVPL